MLNLDDAKVRPWDYYKHPNEVLKDERLTHAEKVAVLTNWAYDESEQSVAEEENMMGAKDRKNLLSEIHQSLINLGVSPDIGSPTKHG